MKPLVGDDVEILIDNGKGVICDIHERTSELIRPTVANVTQAFVVFAIKNPDINYDLLNRFLVLCEHNNIKAIVCLNKVDLVSDEENEENVYDNSFNEKGLKGFFSNLKHIDFKRLTFKNFIRELKKVFLRIIYTIRDIIKAIYKSAKKICEKYNLIVDLWNKKSTQVAITRIKNYVGKLCRSILPKKKLINIDLGFEDPAYTGIALAFIGSLYGFIGETLKVNPNFEEKECRINCKLIGKMSVFSLGIIFIRIMKDKAIKRLISNIDKLKEDLSNE